jgi:murein tripeptide amidase MpaA
MGIPAFDFSHYFTYEEIVSFLHQVAVAYPDLVRLEVIGQSYEGRDLWLVTVTQQSSGNPLDKPAYWIDANTHAGEVTGSAVALYTLHYLVTHYGQDPRVTRLVDDTCVYILPRIAVDGSEHYLTTPYRVRSSVRSYPEPEMRDGLHLHDINGDGRILMMRIPDPCGAWKQSEQDPRVMRPRDPDEFDGSYFTLMPEGLIHQFDGYEVKIAPPLKGMDFNRNYPHEWTPEGTQEGAGSYPFSEPETRAEAEFWRSHPNINGFLTYHTYSAVILRPYSTHADEHFPSQDLETYKLIGEVGSRITGYECVSVYHQFRYDPKSVTTGGMDDYGYDQWGWFGFTTELWDLPTEAGVKKKDYIEWLRRHPESDDLLMMHWNDQALAGQGFIDWQPFDHPQLGSLEIGGWDEKAVWQNAPAQCLPDLCEKHCQFTISHALMSPKLAIAQWELIPVGTADHAQGSRLYRLILQLENRGFLPTYTSQKALERKIVKPIEVELQLPDYATLISGQSKQEIGHLEGRANKASSTFTRGESIDYRRKVEWVISGSLGSTIQIAAVSQRAGKVELAITLTDPKPS